MDVCDSRRFRVRIVFALAVHAIVAARLVDGFYGFDYGGGGVGSPYWGPGGDAQRHSRYRSYLHSEDKQHAQYPPESECVPSNHRCDKHTHCCTGHVCVEYVDKYSEAPLGSGRCLPTLGRDMGSPCSNDAECGEELWCQYGGGHTNSWSCQPQIQTGIYTVRKKLFADECETSMECDVEASMCCQLQKRHRMAPRKVCLYYDHPDQCIGKTLTNKIAAVSAPRAVPHRWDRPNYYDKYGKYSYFHRYY